MSVAVLALRHCPFHYGEAVVQPVPVVIRSRLNATSIAVIALIISVSLAACGESKSQTPTASATTAPVQTSTPRSTTFLASTPTSPSATETPESTDEDSVEDAVTIAPEALDEEIAALVDSIDGLIEIVISWPDGTLLSEFNSYEQIEAASLYKLAIMVEIFVEREIGELTFEEPVVLDSSYFIEDDSVFAEGDIDLAVSIDELMQAMITLSSNVAATALLARVGNENVNSTMQSLGLGATEIRWSPGGFPENPIPDIIETPEGEGAGH